MTTKDLLFPKNAPAPDAAETQSTPGRMSAAKTTPFKSAMDLALDPTKSPQSKKSSATRSGDPAVEPDAPSNVIGLPGRTQGGRTASPSGRESKAGSSISREPVAATEETSEVTENEDEAFGETIVASNILLFPDPSVIIPFPMALACGEAPSLRSDNAMMASSNPEQAPDGSGPTGGNIVPLPLSRNTASSASQENQPAGVDVAKLGLRPVEEKKAPEFQPLPEAQPDRAVSPESQSNASKSIISVAFQRAQDPAGTARSSTPAVPLTQLPVPFDSTEDSARSTGSSSNEENSLGKGGTLSNPASDGGFSSEEQPRSFASEATGIPAAKQKSDMTFSTDTKQGQTLEGRYGSPSEELSGAEKVNPGESALIDFSARSTGATEWQAERPIANTDRLTPEASLLGAVDPAETVDRISRLVVREATLVRQYHSDSMAVVLRPDAETELYVHLSQKNGQIEAVIRCERGDSHQLGALWSQLQDSLASQKVRLAPLQESPSNPSNFNNSSATNFGGQGSGQGSSRQTPDKQSLDEWPAPAASRHDSAHERERGGSGRRRITTSRPGWESWA